MSDQQEIAIRMATREDVSYLIPLMRALCENPPGAGVFNEGRVRAALDLFFARHDAGRIWLAAHGSRAVGYIILTLGFSFEFFGRDAFVDELYVEHEYRRRGIARQLLDPLEEACRELRVNALHLEVDEGNDAAAGLYRRCGFADHDRFLMTKWLVK